MIITQTKLSYQIRLGQDEFYPNSTYWQQEAECAAAMIEKEIGKAEADTWMDGAIKEGLTWRQIYDIEIEKLRELLGIEVINIGDQVHAFAKMDRQAAW